MTSHGGSCHVISGSRVDRRSRHDASATAAGSSFRRRHGISAADGATVNDVSRIGGRRLLRGGESSIVHHRRVVVVSARRRRRPVVVTSTYSTDDQSSTTSGDETQNGVADEVLLKVLREPAVDKRVGRRVAVAEQLKDGHQNARLVASMCRLVK